MEDAGGEARDASQVPFYCTGAVRSGTGCFPLAALLGDPGGASGPAALAVRLHHAGTRRFQAIQSFRSPLHLLQQEVVYGHLFTCSWQM